MAEQFENRYDQLDQKKSFEQENQSNLLHVIEVDEWAQNISKKNPREFAALVREGIGVFWQTTEVTEPTVQSNEGLAALKRDEQERTDKLNPDLWVEESSPLA